MLFVVNNGNDYDFKPVLLHTAGNDVSHDKPRPYAEHNDSVIGDDDL